MAANTVDYMGITVDLDVVGADQIQAGVDKVTEHFLRLGENSNQVKARLQQLFALINANLNSRGLGSIAGDRINSMIDKSIKGVQKLVDLEKQRRNQNNNPNRNQNPNYQRNAIFGEFTQSRLGKAIIGIRSLNLAFSETRGLWKFAEGIEKVNQRLLLLHYTSGVGIGSLKDLGAAASIFGGNAQNIASAEERRMRQMAKARRGEGFGYLQEANWKYGFHMDLGWNANQTREAAIEHARANIDPSEWLPFFELIDPANAKMMAGIARMSGEMYEKWQETQKQLNSYGGLTTSSGENRADAVAKATQEYEMAAAQLSRSWEAVRDQIAVALLPLMTSLIESIRQWTDWVNQHPTLITSLAYLAVGVTTLATVLKSMTWLKWLLRLFSLGGAGAGAGAGAAAGASGAGAAAVGGVLGHAMAGAFAAAIVGGLGYKIGEAILGERVKKWLGLDDESQKEKEDKRNAQWADEDKARKKVDDAQIKRIHNDWLRGDVSEEEINKSFYRGRGKTEALQSFENFKEHFEKVRARIANMRGVAADQLSELDPMQLEHLKNIYSSMTSNTSNTSNVNNSRTQNNQYINISGAQDPQAVGEAVIDAGKVLLGSTLNASSEM